MSQGKIVEGIFAINKPQLVTSAQVLRDLQSHFGRSKLFAPWIQAEQDRRDKENTYQQRRRRDKGPVKVKIGHGGTLDPLATGVLIAGIGKGTKHLSGFLDCTKTYEAVVLFGVATDTYDRLGKVIGRAKYQQITREKVEKALERFHGKIMQRPPIFSALRIDGKRLYEYAREGKEVPGDIKERPVGVGSLELIEWMDGGQHEYKWPTEEARAQDKYVAERILHINGNISAAKDAVITEEQTKETQDETSPKQSSPPNITIQNFSTTPTVDSASSKRKREQVDSDDDLVFDCKRRRSRRATPGFEPLMSGGLPDPATITTAEAPSSVKDSNTDQLPLPTSTSPATTEQLPATATTTTTADPPPSESHSPSLSSSLPPAARLRMTVSSGFYVRSLCHDLGMALGSLGIMCELVRTRQAQFDLGKGNVFDCADLEKGEKVWAPKVEALLDEWWKEQRGEGLGEGEVEVEGGKAGEGEGEAEMKEEVHVGLG